MIAHALNRRAALAALAAITSSAELGHAATPIDAWRSSYAPHNGPLKAPMSSEVILPPKNVLLS